jgi:hypothetical protein
VIGGRVKKVVESEGLDGTLGFLSFLFLLWFIVYFGLTTI